MIIQQKEKNCFTTSKINNCSLKKCNQSKDHLFLGTRFGIINTTKKISSMTSKTNNFSLKKFSEKEIINFQDARTLRVLEGMDVLMKLTEE